MTTSSDLVAENLKRFRKDKGWTAQRLADECTELGAPEISAAVIANIETGRRDIHGVRRRALTVDEMLVLAAALNVIPTQLLTHVADGGQGTSVALTPSVITTPGRLESWLGGSAPFPDGHDEAEFLRYLSATARQEREASRHPVYGAVVELLTFVRAGVIGSGDLAQEDLPGALRQKLERLRRHVELLADDIEAASRG